MLIGALLDCMLTIPLALVVMLCMLQDRKSPPCKPIKIDFPPKPLQK